jgi:putative ABC transport system substrate-binding protein
MKTLFRIRFFSPQSDNRKSKISPELRRRIPNRKLAGIAVVVTIALSGVMSQAQPPGKTFRIGFLDPSTASGSAVLVNAFRQELSKLGWIEEKNFAIEYRFAENKGQERLAELAADLVRLKVDLIVAADTPASLAAKSATTTIPVVMPSAADPVGIGLVASLARPGGNVTGFSNLAYELNTKRLEILTEAVPKLARVGLLRPAGGSDRPLKQLRAAAQALKLKLEEIETQRDPKGLESGFQTAKHKQVTAIMTTVGRSFFAERKRIVELAVTYRSPAIYFQKWGRGRVENRRIIR